MQTLDSTFADEVLRQGVGYLEALLRALDPLEQAVFCLLLDSRAAMSTKAVRRSLVSGFVRYLGTGGKRPYLAPVYDFIPTNPKWHMKFMGLVRREAINKGFADIFDEKPIGVLSQGDMGFYEKVCRAHGFILPGFRRVADCLKNLETLGLVISRDKSEKEKVYSAHPRIIYANEKSKVFIADPGTDSHGGKKEKEG